MSDQKHIDTIISQIPNHIVENYPRFYEFLEAYYEWMMQDGNPYERVRNHMDYLTFEQSLDSYVDFMKYEFLVDLPDDVVVDKELFIKWSRTFNSARGSHASIKFLFKILFGEQSISIYLPKDNILKTSDGVWISGESLMLVTHNTNNLEQFQFQRITQTRPIYNDIVETATATVQSVRTKYIGRYIVTELSISGIEGEFKEGFPIETDAGATEWIIPVLNDVAISDAGSNYQLSQRITIDNLVTNEIERVAETTGEFDTRITSFFTVNDINVFINGTEIFDFTFNGRIVSSATINTGATIKVTLPAYQGYIIVNEVDQDQGVIDVDILDLPIGKEDAYTLSIDGSGSGFTGTTEFGLVKPVNGYYSGTKGQLSSNMYLQDSNFYQNYSYMIKTEQDFISYVDVVKQTLHPAGFLLFGQLSYINIVELILEYQASPAIPANIQNILHKYGLGTNYNTINKFKDNAQIRLWRTSNFATLDSDYLDGEAGYNLDSKYLADRIPDYEYQELKGWMSKFNWADNHLYIPQEYSEENESGTSYFETGYTAIRSL